MSKEYIVVARRYRPQSFDALVGQSHIITALSNAIRTNRIGHAYLFTGARGVGKTSAARIFAKALNCTCGTSAEPCNQCEICQSISAGEDLDVLEIDGASNRGIDEIRQLRSNVGMRPSRARFKVYIIDEVHMLTKEAFNALLKTLEEPPDHVKFIFCTTDPEKIPITVLSRCQRFDFASISYQEIANRLAEIVKDEHAEAEPEALELLARRAGGSMRDSQSLLEQLLSFAGDKITVQQVHDMLGTARVGLLHQITEAMVDQDAGEALRQLDAALAEGVDVGQFAEQLLGYLRDTLAAAAGCQAAVMLHVGPADFDTVKQLGTRWGIATLLAAAQILDQAIARMRLSLQRRTLVEMAIVRISQLQSLENLSELIERLESHDGSTTSAPATSKKKQTSGLSHSPAASAPAEQAIGKATRPASSPASSPTSGRPQVSAADGRPAEITLDATAAWKRAITQLNGIDADLASQYERCEMQGGRLVVHFSSRIAADRCARPDQRKCLEQAVSAAMGQVVQLEFTVTNEPPAAAAARKPNARELIRDSYQHPLVQRAVELFDAEVTRVIRR